jgi:nitrogen PTS system EIIA component
MPPVATAAVFPYTCSRKKVVQSFTDVICCIGSTQKYYAIREVIRSCPIFGDLSDLESFTDAVIRREQLETTGIGRGVAIAHGKLKTIPRVKVGLGISAKGIDFDAADNLPVHLLFVIGSSPFRQIEYLRALAAIMQFVKMSDIRTELLQHTNLDFSDEHNSSCLRFLDMMASQHFLEYVNKKIV